MPSPAGGLVTEWVFAGLCVVVLVGTLLQVCIGFGLGLIAAPVIALADPSLVPVVSLVLTCGINIAVLVREGAHLDLRGTGWALAGRVPGVVAGAVLVAVLPARLLALLVAATVLIGVLATIRGFRPRPTRRAVATAGMVSGLMATATSIGGPPMAVVWQRFTGARLRSTMSAFFLVGAMMSLAALALTGAVHAESLRYVLFLAPATAAGVLLAGPIGRRLDARRWRIAAMAMATTGATILTVQQFAW